MCIFFVRESFVIKVGSWSILKGHRYLTKTISTTSNLWRLKHVIFTRKNLFFQLYVTLPYYPLWWSGPTWKRAVSWGKMTTWDPLFPRKNLLLQFWSLGDDFGDFILSSENGGRKRVVWVVDCWVFVCLSEGGNPLVPHPQGYALSLRVHPCAVPSVTSFDFRFLPPRPFIPSLSSQKQAVGGTSFSFWDWVHPWVGVSPDSHSPPSADGLFPWTNVDLVPSRFGRLSSLLLRLYLDYERNLFHSEVGASKAG